MKFSAFALVAVLLFAGTVFARQEHGHGEGNHHHNGQMAKLHKMMPKYALAQVSISAALGAGDLKTVAEQTGYILSTTPDLKKSKPHKNLIRLKEFRKIAERFEQEVAAADRAARGGDLAATKAAFAGALKKCDACHAKFRD